MKYNPSDYDPAAEAAATEPVQEGDYEFTVANAYERISHNGNEMIEMELSVDVGRDQPITVYDRLVATPAAQWKIYQFCQCVGLDYNEGELTPEDVRGKSGWAHFVVGEPRQAGRSVGRRFLEVGYYRKGKPEGQPARGPAAARPERQVEPAQSGSKSPEHPEPSQAEQQQPAGRNPDLSELPF